MLEEYNRILVAIDGSDEANKAFQKAINYAKHNNKSLVIAQIVPVSNYYYADNGVYMADMFENERNGIERKMADYVKEAKDAGVKDVKSIVETGDPKHMIAKEIPKEEKIDAIILGATGMNALERVFLGSVATYVVNHAVCDVVVVR